MTEYFSELLEGESISRSMKSDDSSLLCLFLLLGGVFANARAKPVCVFSQKTRALIFEAGDQLLSGKINGHCSSLQINFTM